MQIKLVSERKATFGGPTHIVTYHCARLDAVAFSSYAHMNYKPQYVYVHLYILSIYDKLEEIQDCTPVLQNALDKLGAKPSH